MDRILTAEEVERRAQTPSVGTNATPEVGKAVDDLARSHEALRTKREALLVRIRELRDYWEGLKDKAQDSMERVVCAHAASDLTKLLEE